MIPNCSPGRIRTSCRLVNSPLLYPLATGECRAAPPGWGVARGAPIAARFADRQAWETRSGEELLHRDPVVERVLWIEQQGEVARAIDRDVHLDRKSQRLNSSH